MGTSLRVDVLRFDKVERFDQHQVKPKSGCTPFHRSSHLSHTLWVFVGSTLGLLIHIISIHGFFSSGDLRTKSGSAHIKSPPRWWSLHVSSVDSKRQDTLSRGRKASEIQRTPIYARYLSTCQYRYPLRIYNWMWQMDATCFMYIMIWFNYKILVFMETTLLFAPRCTTLIDHDWSLLVFSYQNTWK